jgi:hypothetical protein
VVHCLARRLESLRIPAAYRKPLKEERLLVMALEAVQRFERMNAVSVEMRNQVVAALSGRILVIHDHPGGMLERLCKGWLAEGCEVWALESPANQGLSEMGVWGEED